MGLRPTTLAGAAIAAFAMAGAASAADRTEAVHFKSGTSSATIAGKIKGYDGVNYILGAKAGQVISVLFSPDNSSCYFNFFAPGSDEAIHIGSTSGNEFSGTLSKSGDQRAQVYLMRSAARRNEVCKYSITFEISGDAAGGTTPSDNSGLPAADIDACLKAVSNNDSSIEVVVLDTETSEANNMVKVGLGPNHAPWRCLVKDGKVSDVMSLTDEGAQ
jgi:hypothetical protein